MRAKEAYQLLQSRKEVVPLDIRTPEEFNEGHIEKAVLIDYHEPDFREQIAKLNRDTPYLLYCRTGRRTTSSLKVFKELNFKEIIHLEKGIVDWQDENLPVLK